jgi:hypothetical protein
MFETLFTDVLNSEHELLRGARLIDWDGLHGALSVYYSLVGRHGKSIGKFRSLVAGVIPPTRAEILLERVLHLEEIPDIGRLLSA